VFFLFKRNNYTTSSSVDNDNEATIISNKKQT